MIAPSHPGKKSTARLLWALFSLFIVYGTTVPFSFDLPSDGLSGLLRGIQWHPLGARNGELDRADILQNILLFIPFGFLGYIALVDKRQRWKKVALVAMGAALSAVVEGLQLFAPTRWTAVSDVVFNTSGTAAGVFLGAGLKGWVMSLQGREEMRRRLEAPSAFPALTFTGLAVFGSWEPFDFALSVVDAARKVRHLLLHPFDLSWPNDEGTVFIRFLLATLFACRLASECGLPRPRRVLVPLLALAAIGLEATQVIIGSRAPSFQDAATSVLGVLGGAVAYGFPGFHLHPWRWGAIGILAVTAAATLDALHPFAFAPSHAGFQWMPFMSEYARTTFAALGNFLEGMLAWFPMGFLLGYFFPGSRRPAWVSLALAASAAFALEGAQGFVVGRSADITDVIAACMGSLAGSLALSRGWKAYRAYTARD